MNENVADSAPAWERGPRRGHWTVYCATKENTASAVYEYGWITNIVAKAHVVSLLAICVNRQAMVFMKSARFWIPSKLYRLQPTAVLLKTGELKNCPSFFSIQFYPFCHWKYGTVLTLARIMHGKPDTFFLFRLLVNFNSPLSCLSARRLTGAYLSNYIQTSPLTRGE